MTLPRLAITMGDPAGIGPEIVLKALEEPEIRAACEPVVIGDAGVLRRAADRSGLDVELVGPDDRSGDPRAVRVMDVGAVPEDLELGTASAPGGEAAYAAIEAGTALCREGGADALVTAPINKAGLELAGRGHEGHTEILQRLAEVPWSLTVFILPDLRVLYLTRHLSLRDAIDAVTAERIDATLANFAGVAPQIGLSDPEIAVAALNPHAGEGGLFGREELDEITPGVELARARGLRVQGPIPADSVFHQARQGRYDIVLCLYHDQAASITKTLDFHGTVSVTLGLPFLRFSVDHGTAYDIAGQGIAEADNMVETLRVAARMT